jgi:hypothetical protein
MAIIDPEALAATLERIQQQFSEMANQPGDVGAYGRFGPVAVAFERWMQGEIERETSELDMLGAGTLALGAALSMLALNNDCESVEDLLKVASQTVTSAIGIHTQRTADRIPVYEGKLQ